MFATTEATVPTEVTLSQQPQPMVRVVRVVHYQLDTSRVIQQAQGLQVSPTAQALQLEEQEQTSNQALEATEVTVAAADVLNSHVE
jgi:hypothetical protein